MKKEDIPEVLRGWNEALPLDAAGAEKFERIVLGDPNYDAGGTLVAVGRGGIVGFATCVAPQLSPEDQESWRAAEKDFAFLKGVFYGDEPAGEALLERVTEFARSRRKRIIRIVQYGGGKWFFPGIDLRYEGLLGFFQRNGFEQTRQIQDVTLDLTSYRPGRGEYQRRQWEKLKAAGIEIVAYRPELLRPARVFVKELGIPSWFGPEWEEQWAETRRVVLAVGGGRVLGFSRYGLAADETGVGQLGPIGTLTAERGKGIGSCMLDECMGKLKAAGARTSVARWANTPFYLKNGWRVWREYAVLQKRI